MRYAVDHKQKTKLRILDGAGRLFRREGIAGASVEKVMSAAGLTVGGFYAHFRSKRSLLVEAMQTLMSERRQRAERAMAGRTGDRAISAFVSRYVSVENRDEVERGCPVLPVLSEIAREDVSVRRAFATELASLVEVIARAVGGRWARANALRAIALCFGAVALARATAGTPLSQELLDACRGGERRSVKNRRPLAESKDLRR
jgi:TetR/AcrR family transcriptional regulator, transcriptional repressor for nem operon